MNLSKLLSKYICRLFIYNFLAVFLCLFAVIILFDFAELQRRAGSREVDILLKFTLILLRAPHFLEQVMPFLIFASSLFVFWRLNRSNELIVTRSMGISLWQIILPISLTALLIACIDLTLFNPLSTAMQERAESLDRRYVSKSKDEFKLSSTGLWLSEMVGKNQIIYRADKIHLKNLEFSKLNIILSSPQNQFLGRIDADKAHVKGKELILSSGWEIKPGNTATQFKTKVIPTSLTTAKIKNMRANQTAFSFWQLPSYIKLLEAAGLHSLKYKMRWHSMIASVFWAGAMVLLAAAFACRPLRQGKTILLILCGVIVGFFLYFFKDLTFALGASNKLPPILAVWISPLVTLMVGAVLVFYQEDG